MEISSRYFPFPHSNQDYEIAENIVKVFLLAICQMTAKDFLSI